MDLWVVAAATGAGYLAKYLQNSSEEKEELSEIWDQNCPFRTLARTKGSYRDVCSRGEDDVTYKNYKISDIFTLTSLQENVGKISEDCNIFFELETDPRKRPLRSKKARGFSIKPPSPLENCLTTRLDFEKRAKVKYVFSPPPSLSSPLLRPVLVTDGNEIIGRGSSGSSGKLGDDVEDMIHLEEKNAFLKPRLSREYGSVELLRTREQKCRKNQSNIAGSLDTLPSRDSYNGIVLFYAGITIGVLSSIITNKRELENLNAQLEQTDNLVRDLQEEIEMKHRITVKDISYQDNQSQVSTNRSSNWELIVSSSQHGSKESCDQNVENLELFMSNIEAELEAELEKLESNLKSSAVERICDFLELGSNFEADVVRGDLKVNTVQPFDTNHFDSNYAVSPWDLSLRLYEVIESRLLARIEELELALRNNKKRQSLEWLRIISNGGLENGEVGSSSTPEIQICTYEFDNMDKPLGICDERNEAYEEVIRLTDSDEEGIIFGMVSPK